ncbi:unnamed protein product, partial [marine sediment metagenome]
VIEADEAPTPSYQGSHISPDGSCPADRFQLSSPVGDVTALAFLEMSLDIIGII